jgi:hypothetical protein
MSSNSNSVPFSHRCVCACVCSVCVCMRTCIHMYILDLKLRASFVYTGGVAADGGTVDRERRGKSAENFNVGAKYG